MLYRRVGMSYARRCGVLEGWVWSGGWKGDGVGDIEVDMVTSGLFICDTLLDMEVWVF